MRKWKPFNINHYVRVKMTPRGMEIMAKNHAKYSRTPFTPPKSDEDGWTEFQLWRLIEEFGSDMTMGSEVTFGTNIEFEVTKNA